MHSQVDPVTAVTQECVHEHKQECAVISKYTPADVAGTRTLLLEQQLLPGLGARIKSARGTASQKTLAEEVGVHPNTIGKLERGDVAPDALTLVAIAHATNVSAAWLLMGDGFPRAGFAWPSEPDLAHPEDMQPKWPTAALVPKAVEAVEVGDYVYVPHFDTQASAGPDFFNHVEAVIAMRPFETTYIRRELGIAHNSLALLNIAGRSMEPLLRARDVSLVDLRDREATVEGVHVIRLDGGLYVKHLQRLPGRVLRVTSKNPEFQSYDITPDESSDRDFAVLGRLRWAGVTLS